MIEKEKERQKHRFCYYEKFLPGHRPCLFIQPPEVLFRLIRPNGKMHPKYVSGMCDCAYKRALASFSSYGCQSVALNARTNNCRRRPDAALVFPAPLDHPLTACVINSLAVTQLWVYVSTETPRIQRCFFRKQDNAYVETRKRNEDDVTKEEEEEKERQVFPDSASLLFSPP